MNKLSRRDFLKDAAAGALGLAGMSLLGGCQTSTSSAAGDYTYAETIAWDGQYDVVVVGFGGAGATAAHYAAASGANVLIADAAPKGHEGGNTRYAQQFIVCGDNPEKLQTYYHELAGGLEYDEEVIKVYTENMVTLGDRMASDYGADVMYWKGVPSVAWAIPEFPELEGGEAINAFTVHAGAKDSALWKLLRQKVVEEKDKIDIWFNSRAAHLIQEPQTKTIIGVTFERDGKMVNIRATNGVVLACGGFENNSKIVQDYIGYAHYNVIGSTYNQGDGIHLCLEAGADLWHMNCFEGSNTLGGLGPDYGAGERGIDLTGFSAGSFLITGLDGRRYFNETAEARHGHIRRGGEYVMPGHPQNAWLIFDQNQYETLSWPAFVQGQIIAAESVLELAAALKMEAAVLSRTIKKFNRFASAGEDLEFERDPQTMRELAGKTWYALRLVPRILNTQGGARRNARAEVLDPAGNAIPHLYSAGEFGGLTAKNYQGATNLSECLVFGRIAGENAATVKEALPSYTLAPAVESKLTYTQGTTDEKTSEYELEENEVLGVGAGMGGDVVVAVKIENGAVARIRILENNETQGISDPAFATLPDQFIGCASAEEIDAIDHVSKATVTSNALKEAVKNALNQLQ